MRLFELPCEGWQGWHMHSGKLWTPEGFGFTPDCQSWWSLLVRQARLFRDMAVRERQMAIALQRIETESPGAVCQTPAARRGALAPLRAAAPDALPGAAGRAAKPTGPNLFIDHFRTHTPKKGLFSLENELPDFAMKNIAYVSRYEINPIGGQV
jgi:hypothetical protein